MRIMIIRIEWILISTSLLKIVIKKTMNQPFDQDVANQQLSLERFKIEIEKYLINKFQNLRDQNKCDTQLEALLQYLTTIKEEINIKLDIMLQQIQDGIQELKILRKLEIQKLNRNNQLLTLASIQQIQNQIKEEQGNKINVFMKNIYQLEIKTNEQYQDLLNYLQTKIRQPPVLVQIQENKYQDNLLNVQILQQGSHEQIDENNIPKFLQKEEVNNEAIVNALALSKDGRLLATVESDKIQFWAFNSQKQTLIAQDSFEIDESVVVGLILSEGKNWLITATTFGQLTVWEKSMNGQWVSTQKLVHNESFNHFLLSENEKELFLLCDEKPIKIYTKENNNDQWKIKQTLKGHTNEAYNLSLSPNNTQLASSGKDKLIIWKKNNEDQKWEWSAALGPKYQQSCFLNEKELIAITEGGKLIRFLENADGEFEIVQELTLLEKRFCQDIEFHMNFNKYTRMILVQPVEEFTFILFRKSNGEIILHQKIEQEYSAGTISLDGKVIILAQNMRLGIQLLCQK